jgi:cytochrome c oxidase assembly protein subunit 15
VTPDAENRALHRFAMLTAAATLFLISVGGMVTSHGAGMAVPDWPNTYGYNLFFFPFSSWIGGIFYEHSHRLVASAVGLMTLILAAWLYGRNSRPGLRWGGAILLLAGSAMVMALPSRWQDASVLGATGAAALVASFVWPQAESQPRWLLRLGLLAVGLVILQGVLGGLRVTLFKDELGIVHATLAQLFFVLTGAIALFTSRCWRELAGDDVAAPQQSAANTALGHKDGGALPRRRYEGASRPPAHLGKIYFSAAMLVLAQLILGATMRHQHAGLAVPDFPLAYGKLWPATDAGSVAAYNRSRLETRALNDITANQIRLHMAHRLMAVAVGLAIGACWWLTRRKLARGHVVRRLAGGWCALVTIQFCLGAWTVWSNKAADITTLHVVTGALTLLTGALLTLVSFRCHPSTSPPPARTDAVGGCCSSRFA